MPAWTSRTRIVHLYTQRPGVKKTYNKKLTCSDLLRRKGRHVGMRTRKILKTENIKEIVHGELLEPFNGRSKFYFTFTLNSSDSQSAEKVVNK